MMEENKTLSLNSSEKASYNQANLYQLRTHELFSRINRLSTNPREFNEQIGAYNFEIIFRDLSSVLSTISCKLKTDERKTILTRKKAIKNFLILNPPFNFRFTASNYRGSKKKLKLDYKNLLELEELLFSFRLSIEKLMDIHEFGNPSKEDPTASVVGN